MTEERMSMAIKPQRIPAAVTLAAILFLAAARAQEPAPQSAPPQLEPRGDEDSAQEPIRAEAVLVTTPVTVEDDRGEFVFGLREPDFVVLDEGVPQRIERFVSEARPVSAVIVIQTSRDVSGTFPQISGLGPVFSSLLLGPAGQAAVITFDDRVRVAQDFSSDDDQLVETLGKLEARGDQARLNDAMMRALALLERRSREERRIVVVIGDGFDRGSETVDEEVVRRATGGEVTIYGLGLNPAAALATRRRDPPPPDPLDTNVARPVPPNRPPTPSESQRTYGTPIPLGDLLRGAGQALKSLVGDSPLEFYANYTGGAFYSHATKRALSDHLSRVAAEVQSQYELAYVPTSREQAGFRRIEVQVKRPGLKVRARAGYFFQPGLRPVSRGEEKSGTEAGGFQ
jgi:VWFA-related protein